MSSLEALARFRTAHELRFEAAGAHVWNVIDCGSGPETIVLLPGGGASAESDFPLIEALESDARVIALGVPPTVSTVRDTLDGMHRILFSRRVERFFLLGHSFGGLIALFYAIDFPQHVEALVLANAANYSKTRGKYLKLLLAGVSRLPLSAMVALLRARVRDLLRGREDRDFWLAFFSEGEVARVGRAGLVNRARCLAEMIDRGAPPVGAPRFDGPMLIIESDRDAGFTAAERAALKQACPQARSVMLQGAGHLSNLTRPRQFADAVRSFILCQQRELKGSVEII